MSENDIEMLKPGNNGKIVSGGKDGGQWAVGSLARICDSRMVVCGSPARIVCFRNTSMWAARGARLGQRRKKSFDL
jgi:hypothetical protein